MSQYEPVCRQREGGEVTVSLLGVAASRLQTLPLGDGGREGQQFKGMLAYTVNEFEASVGCSYVCLSQQTDKRK